MVNIQSRSFHLDRTARRDIRPDPTSGHLGPEVVEDSKVLSTQRFWTCLGLGAWYLSTLEDDSDRTPATMLNKSLAWCHHPNGRHFEMGKETGQSDSFPGNLCSRKRGPEMSVAFRAELKTPSSERFSHFGRQNGNLGGCRLTSHHFEQNVVGTKILETTGSF